MGGITYCVSTTYFMQINDYPKALEWYERYRDALDPDDVSSLEYANSRIAEIREELFFQGE